MFETAVALLAAHVLADFVFQSRWMVAHKKQASVFASHIAIVAGTAAVCLGVSRPAPTAALGTVLIVGLSHAAIDAVKVFVVENRQVERDSNTCLTVFALDQIAHLAFIALAAGLFPAAFAHGGQTAAGSPSSVFELLQVYIVATGFIIATRVGQLVLAPFLAGFHRAAGAIPEKPEYNRRRSDKNLSDSLRAGAWIGILERSLVFMFVLLGQFNAIGFVIAAKSILRFRYARHPRQGEIVIIGTMASFGWAIGVAELARFALGHI